jgi:threonine/homoserine/homoserine lactone efflux protein
MLTLTNPLTIISFLGFFTGIGFVNSQGALSSALLLVIGVFLGSSLWWIILCSVISILKERLEMRSLKMINRLAGSIVFLFGITSLLEILK